MQIYLFLLFIAVPIIEIALFIQAGQLIGVLPTIALTIGTAIAGSFLMRVQGFKALNRFTEAAAKGEMPVTPVIDGIGILMAGVLLLTPGLLTDALGLLLFIPPVRRGVMRWVFRNALQGGRVHVRTYGTGETRRPTRGAGPGQAPGSKPGFRKSDNVIDAEFETIKPGDAGSGPAGPDARKKPSPWRRRN
jgi:UPF0716 protein FxsA